MTTKLIDKKLKVLPDKPGIYKMLDKNNKILYIGKAKNLKNRVRSYFNKNIEREFTKILVSKIKDIEIIITRTEKEALLLENNLIKQFKPYYNIDLKDNKTFPYIKITTNEAFPRVIKTRVYNKTGSYFGPYTDVSALNEHLQIINDFFPLKKCKRTRFPKGFKPCLYFHMGKCLDYCTGNVKKSDYLKYVIEVKEILKGKHEKLINTLTNLMQKQSKMQLFENALATKNKITTLKALKEKQHVNYLNEKNFDVIHYFTSENTLNIAHLNFRNGKLLDRNTCHYTNDIINDDMSNAGEYDYIRETFSNYMIQYYQKLTFPVPEIIIPFSPKDLKTVREIITETLAARNNLDKKYKLKLTFPLMGEKKRLLELAHSNAKLSFYELIKEKRLSEYGEYLKSFLKLKKIPKVVESFDIANTGDSAIVAGMVSYKNGKKDKENYRIFNIKSTGNRQDDVKSIEEAVYRRYKRLLEEKRLFPDLILIDGGKGQLSAAARSLSNLGIKGQPIIAIAKREEEIFVPKKSEPLKISQENPGLKFLIAVRNETHRFTNKIHVLRRDKEELKSVLLKVSGLGQKKIRLLMNRFDSIENIKTAGHDEILDLPFFSEVDFKNLQDFFVSNQ